MSTITYISANGDIRDLMNQRQKYNQKQTNVA